MVLVMILGKKGLHFPKKPLWQVAEKEGSEHLSKKTAVQMIKDIQSKWL